MTHTFDQFMEAFQYTEWKNANSKHCAKEELKLKKITKHIAGIKFLSNYRIDIQHTFTSGM
jgi:hypothetical protein